VGFLDKGEAVSEMAIPARDWTALERIQRIQKAEELGEDRRGRLRERAQTELALKWGCQHSAAKAARSAVNVEKRRVRRRSHSALPTAEGAMNGR